ncbi:hypothetical protein EBR66_07825, partial [bacterium]|nr:hypothetical protein [bacterium]
ILRYFNRQPFLLNSTEELPIEADSPTDIHITAKQAFARRRTRRAQKACGGKTRKSHIAV